MRILKRLTLRAAAAATVSRDVRATAVSPARPVHRPGAPAARRAREGLSRPRHGRGARGRGEGAAAAAVEVSSTVGRRNLALLQLVRSAGPEGSERLPHVRPPHGRTATLRGGRVRLTRTTRLAVGIVVLALAGCGGAQVTVNDVPGGPVDLKTPGTGQGFAAVTPTATATATPTETPTADTSTGAAPTATPQADTTTQDNTPQADPNGGATAPQTDDGTAAQQPPDPGASSDEFEDYCAQNPGAC